MKELKALDWLVKEICFQHNVIHKFPSVMEIKNTDEYRMIENALKEYEGAKNHIEALHKERVENAIKLKALEIIKKAYNFSFLDEDRLVMIDDCYGLTFANQEEYDLLKEWLSNE